MHNPIVFRATFRDLIKTIFGKEQILKWHPEIEMFQISDSPEKWGTRMASAAGRLEWVAASPHDLACLIEDKFVARETEWIPHRPSGAILPRRLPDNVIIMPLKRQA